MADLEVHRGLKRLKDFRVRTTVREFTGKLACKILSNLSEFKMVIGEQWLDNSLEAVEEFKTDFSHLCSFDKDFVGNTLKTTDIPLDVRYKGLVGCKIPLCKIPLCHNTFMGEPLYNEGLIR